MLPALPPLPRRIIVLEAKHCAACVTSATVRSHLGGVMGCYEEAMSRPTLLSFLSLHLLQGIVHLFR